MYKEGWVRSADGVRLSWRRRSPEAGEPVATLLFVHGLGEHSGRYQGVLDSFAERGFECWALDCRGHGMSPGRRVHVKHFDELLADVRSVAELALDKAPNLPFFPVGHSQGGLIVLRYALTHPEDLAGVIASSPFLAVHPDTAPGAALRAVARALSVLAPGLMFPSGVDADLLSHDPRVCTAYREDPLVSRRVSARWFTSVTAAQTETRAGAAELRVPALIMQSGADRIVDPAATRDWATAAPAELVEYVEWEGLYHEMFNEPERERVFARMEEWLRARIGR